MQRWYTCSWCHQDNLIAQDGQPTREPLCVACGHRSDLPRRECDCPECSLHRQTWREGPEGLEPDQGDAVSPFGPAA